MASYSFKPAVIGDDGMWRDPSSFYNQYVGIGNYAGNSQHSFIRFPNVSIPQGTTITSAVLKFKALRTDASNVVTKIYGNDVADAVAPTTYAGGESLVLTTANADWTPANWTAESFYNSIDITAVIQEILDRGDWVSGNAMQILIIDNGSTGGAERYAYDFNDDNNLCTRLIVEYGPAVFSPTTLNPDDVSGLTLSGGNLTWTNQLIFACVGRSIGSESSSLWYFDADVSVLYALGTQMAIGLAPVGASLSSLPGALSTTYGVRLLHNGGGGSLIQAGNNDSWLAVGSVSVWNAILHLAWNADNGNLWAGYNGIWYNSGDPAAGTNPTFTNVLGAFYVMVGTLSGGVLGGTIDFGQFGTYLGAPTGFNAGFGGEPHTITATAGANGSISPSGAVSVTDGGSQTFTVTSTFTGSAATAFIKDVLVDSVSAGRVVSYAFTNVTADHTISASFLAWPDAKAIETVVREIINETTPAHFTDAMILNWTNEAVRDIAIKTSCIEAIFSATTTSGSRLVPITGHKVRFVEYIPASGNRVGLQAIIPKSLGRLPFNGITPQYWFQWGADIVIDPEPTAAYSLNLYTASWPDYLMSDLDDEPLIDVDFQILILAYVLSKALIRRRHFATAAVCYQLYVSSLNKLKARRIKRRKDNTPMLKLPDALQKGKGSVNV